MKKTEIIISGVGGQGCVSGGNLLAQAAAIYDGKEALAAVSYGSEARGTFSKSEVIISGSQIYFPYAQKPNYIIVMDPVAYDRYVDEVTADTVILYDSDTVTERPSKAAQFGFPMSTMAVSAGSIASLNIVALGILAKRSQAVSFEALEQAIQSRFGKKPKVCASNLTALRSGYEA